MITGLLLLFLFQFLGEVIVHFTGLPVPGPVIGMLLLLVTLIARQDISDTVAPAANMLIRYLILLFFPAGVGIFVLWENYAAHSLTLLVAVGLGTLVLVPLVALLLNSLLRKEAPDNSDTAASHD